MRVHVLLLLTLTLLAAAAASGSSASDYYQHLDTGLDGAAFRQALHALISSNTTQLTYKQVWTAFATTDMGIGGCGQNELFDIYSSTCWEYGTQQCGNFNGPGQCYNREHSWPKSWWGGSSSSPAYTDMVHMFPTDGYDNAQRSNLPFGLVDSVKYETSNGCRRGTCASAVPGWSGSCWEPLWKGQLARVYLYMVVRYMDQFTCCPEPQVDAWWLQPWAQTLLLQWHQQQPVSALERARNDAVFQVQGNRNPFVDHPEWASKVGSFVRPAAAHADRPLEEDQPHKQGNAHPQKPTGNTHRQLNEPSNNNNENNNSNNNNNNNNA